MISLLLLKKVVSKDILLERVATMSCKAAVKGNNELPLEQAQELRLLKITSCKS